MDWNIRVTENGQNLQVTAEVVQKTETTEETTTLSANEGSAEDAVKMYSFKLIEGLEVTIIQCENTQGVTLHKSFKASGKYATLSCCVEGKMVLDNISTEDRAAGHAVTPGQMLFFIGKEYGYDISVRDGQQVTLGMITIAPEVVKHYFSKMEGELSDELLNDLVHNDDYVFSACVLKEVRIQALVAEILNAQYTGIVKDYFYESRALQVISVYIEQIIKTMKEKQSIAATRLKPAEIQKVKFAKDILLRDLSSPITIPELAKAVGMSETYLKQHFKAVFGSSIFECFQQQRMEKAKMLLQTTDRNVSEVADDMGYASPSSFIIAFRKYFGVNPGAVKGAAKGNIKEAIQEAIGAAKDGDSNGVKGLFKK